MISRTASRLVAAGAALATVGVALLSPLAARADGNCSPDGYRYYQRHDGDRFYRPRVVRWNGYDNSIQAQKNTMRNVEIGSAVLGVIGLANHNSTEAIVGAAGAIIAGSQESRDQQIENQQHNWFYHRF